MKIKRHKKYSFLETCAASDLAFLLIIYFLVIAGFNISKGFIINLPAKDSAKIVYSEDIIRFEMNQNGEINFNNGIVSISGAEAAIRSGRSSNPNITVVITIDSQAKWQNVVSFVELAQNLQIESFSFSMKKDSP
ncbi:MAG: biopolymer transporter ExbD [Treponema sp.]|nr:biopolymer transporter ExbD [Treponema sp.]